MLDKMELSSCSGLNIFHVMKFTTIDLIAIRRFSLWLGAGSHEEAVADSVSWVAFNDSSLDMVFDAFSV